jgi:hypothetical protein
MFDLGNRYVFINNLTGLSGLQASSLSFWAAGQQLMPATFAVAAEVFVEA